jgi:hypothetical protein
MSSDREWLERSIIRLNNEMPNEPKGTPTLSLDVDIAAMLQDIIAKEEQNTSPDEQPETRMTFQALGLMGVSHFSTTIRLEDDQMVTDSTLQVSDLTKGIFTLFNVQPSTLPTVNFIPENITALEVGRMDLLGLWKEVPNIVTALSPDGKLQYDMIVGMIQMQLGINLERDLLAHLGTQYISYVTTASDTEPQASIVGLELKNSAAFKTGIETIFSAPTLQPQISAAFNIDEFLEHTLYSLKNDVTESVLAFSISGDYLFYGLPDAVRTVIRTQSNPAAAHNNFEHSTLVQGLRQHTPASAFGFQTCDWKKSMDNLVRELKKPMIAAAVKQAFAKEGLPFPAPDFTQLPPAEHIASFFNTSFQYIEATDTGLHHRLTLKY